MFESGTLIILGLVTVAAFGVGGVTVARWLTARPNRNDKDND